MKKYFCLILFTLSVCALAQESEIQKSDSLNISKTIIFKPAEFPGGDEAFRKELFKMIHGYIDLNQYYVNGVFKFEFRIDKKGKIIGLNVTPKVKNSEMFLDDMTFAAKRVKTKWKPAAQNGIPVESDRIVLINFITDHYDHD